jgi:hypothetical protein
MLFPGRRLPAREKTPALCVLCASVVKLRHRAARERLRKFKDIRDVAKLKAIVEAIKLAEAPEEVLSIAEME